jgi:hypothetical protein
LKDPSHTAENVPFWDPVGLSVKTVALLEADVAACPEGREMRDTVLVTIKPEDIGTDRFPEPVGKGDLVVVT